MKKQMILVAFGFACIANVKAGDGSTFYVKLNGGYNLGLASTIPYNLGDYAYGPTVVAGSGNTIITNNNSTGASTTQSQSMPLNLGAGISYGGAIGMMFNQYLGAELNFSYLMGSTYKASLTEIEINSYYNGSNTSTYTYNNTMKASLFNLAPMVVLQVPLNEKIKPYIKFGPVFGFGGITATESTTSTPYQPGNTNTTETDKYSGGMAFGMSSGLGVEFAINNQFSVFAEVIYTAMSYEPSQVVVTAHTSNGVNDLSQMTKYETQTNFVSNLNFTTVSGTPTDTNDPNQSTKIYLPLSNVGVQIGVKMNLGRN